MRGIILTGIAVLFSTTAYAETTQDHFKEVYHKTPHYVEVCYDKQVSGDKTADTLKGAILGGVMRLVVQRPSVKRRLDIQRRKELSILTLPSRLLTMVNNIP